jgi:hypothetical protein
VTGRRAHRGETIYEVIRSVGEGSFPPPRVHRPDIPPELENAILRAMALEPAQRFASVREFGRAILPLATPAARAKWAPAFAGDDSAAAHAASTLPRASQPGGTVVFATPAPSNGGGGSAGPPAPFAPPANTTFGSSAAQMTLPARSRSGWIVGGFVAAAAVGVVAYVVTQPASRHARPGETPRTAETSEATTAVPAPSKPARYRVSVAALPRAAAFELDGTRLGTGRIDEDLPLDGSEHTLVVSATGFVPARLTFRNRPPAEEVKLEPLPAPSKNDEAANDGDHPTRSAPGHHAHATAHHDKPQPAPPPAAKPAGSLRRTENNAAIIDD